jgi:hypothetical protein
MDVTLSLYTLVRSAVYSLNTAREFDNYSFICWGPSSLQRVSRAYALCSKVESLCSYATCSCTGVHHLIYEYVLYEYELQPSGYSKRTGVHRILRSKLSLYFTLECFNTTRVTRKGRKWGTTDTREGNIILACPMRCYIIYQFSFNHTENYVIDHCPKSWIVWHFLLYRQKTDLTLECNCLASMYKVVITHGRQDGHTPPLQRS